MTMMNSIRNNTLAKKLFTKEDPLHVHKVLGILVLLSYGWRLPKLLSYESDMGFASHPSWTVPTLFLHLCLNLSSFEFYIPTVRTKQDSRIWPEYRLHALIFAARCIVCMAINWYEEAFDVEPNYNLNYIAVIMTMLAADWVSNTVKHHSSSIQELNAPPGVRYFFSTMQFFGTSAALCRYKRRYAVLFYNMFVLQLTPFVMTLRRKNLVSHVFNVSFYGFMLAYGVLVGLLAVIHDLGILRLIACAAALWRMGPFPLKNKYLIWTVMHLLLENFFRPVFWDGKPNRSMRLAVLKASDIMTILVVVYGVYSHYSRRSKETKPVKVKD